MGAKQAGLFCAILQLMKKTITLICFLAAAPSFAQQPATPSAQPAAQSSDQQARSYIASAFMTGAAPMIVSDDVVVQPELRQRLGLAPEAKGRAVYEALLKLTTGKLLLVRPAIRDEVLKSQALAAPGKPIFTLEAGDTTLVIQYDLERENIAFVGQPAQIATAAPVTPPTTVQQVPEPPTAVTQTPAAETPAPTPAPTPAALEPPAAAASAPAAAPAPEPAPAPAAAPTPKPAPPQAAVPPPAAEPAKPVLQVVEPQVPRAVKQAPLAAPKEQTARAPLEALRALPKPSGPCEIKPVMSDQDLVNCGATPRY